MAAIPDKDKVTSGYNVAQVWERFAPLSFEQQNVLGKCVCVCVETRTGGQRFMLDFRKLPSCFVLRDYKKTNSSSSSSSFSSSSLVCNFIRSSFSAV